MLADRYELDREIGRGGASTVWLGRDTVLNRAVALKRIGFGHGGDDIDLDRAEREAHLTARINHQHVVAVFDLVDDGADQWLVMEYVDGPSLAEVIAARGRVEEPALTSMIREVAGALTAAHDHGIVHRDVKPSNILLTSDGTAKLSDFGVARAQADASLTLTGIVLGSPAYLSPEVARGGTATPASDVWSLGATVFHALTGHVPGDLGGPLEPGGQLSALVAQMMLDDPAARPTMAAVETSLALADDVDASAYADVTADADATQGFVAFAEPEPTVPAEPAPTEAMRPVPPPPPPAPPAPVLPAPDLPTPVSHGAAPAQSGPSARSLWIAVAVASVVLLVVVVTGIGGGGNDPADDLPAASGTGQTSTPDPTEADDPTTPDGDGVTAGALEGFAADYLATASNDPEAGFALLTPAYQQESDGFEGYSGFWGKVSDLDVEQIEADTDALTVSYTYSYDFDGDRRTEAVTQRLEQTGDGLRVAGAV